jgi:hypothetical protein
MYIAKEIKKNYKVQDRKNIGMFVLNIEVIVIVTAGRYVITNLLTSEF